MCYNQSLAAAAHFNKAIDDERQDEQRYAHHVEESERDESRLRVEHVSLVDEHKSGERDGRKQERSKCPQHPLEKRQEPQEEQVAHLLVTNRLDELDKRRLPAVQFDDLIVILLTRHALNLGDKIPMSSLEQQQQQQQQQKDLTRMPLSSSFIIFKRASCILYLRLRRCWASLPRIPFRGKQTTIAMRPTKVDTPKYL